MDNSEPLDCAIVGGGPAGLTASVYFARFRRRFLMIDSGDSRANWIPTSHNAPGFPEGISGVDLLERMRAHARKYGAARLDGRVDALRRPSSDGFELQVGDRVVRAKTVVLATGTLDRMPDLEHLKEGVARGLIRICPVCDAFETVGKRVGVLGRDGHAAAEALFVRTYSDQVTLILTDATASLEEDRRRELTDAHIEVVFTPLDTVRIEQTEVRLNGRDDRFDTVYLAFGAKPRNELVEQAGARTVGDGCLWTDEHQRTSVEGLYAAGDLVRGLNQTAVATGEAAIAATAIHNALPRQFA